MENDFAILYMKTSHASITPARPHQLRVIFVAYHDHPFIHPVEIKVRHLIGFKGKWQYIFLFSCLKEHLKPYIKLFYRFFISCLLLQIF
jgi:hypothetical protein